MSRFHDPDLDSLFDREPGLERYANLLRAARLKPPPLDPNFRPALRRRLMQAAYDNYQTRQRPSIFARLFSGPSFAIGAAAVAILLLAAIVVFNGGNLLGPGQVQVTTVGAVAVNQPITVSFSQAMDHHSVEKAIQIEPATQVTYTWHGNSLSIQPASGELAPNTQYHVTVAAEAKTAPGVKIGQATTLNVNTAPLPSPPPSPSPSPSPSPVPQITGERSLAGTTGRIVGWSPDGKTLFFIDVNDLKSINLDGSALKTLQAGVRLASVAPSGASLAYVTTADRKLYEAALDGSSAKVVDTRDVSAIGWQSGKPVVLSNGDLGPAGAAPVAKLPGPAGTAFFAPDGSRLVVITGASTDKANPQPIGTYLFDIGSQKQTPWATPAQAVAWGPDSTRVAFWRGGAVLLAAPDGSGATELAKSPDPAGISWSADGKLLLFANASGASLVKADGSGLRPLAQAAFLDPVWTTSGSQFAFSRGGLLWVDDVSLGGTTIDLGAAGKIVDAYEQAHIKNDPAAASGLLTATASPAASPSPLAADVHLARYFVISSQADANQVRYTVRLIFATKTSTEIRYQDELLVLVPAGNDLKIDSITDATAHDLGKGPTVNSVDVQFGKVVVVFDSDLDPKTVDGGSLRLTGADGSPVKFTSDFASRRLTITVQLSPGAKYSLAISSDVKDIAGQALQGGYRYDFVALGPTPSPGG